MNHERSSTASQPPTSQPSRRAGTPVVIRPMQPLEGTDQSVRVDAPEAVRGPHRRNERLEEYVRWLQQNSHQQLTPKSSPPVASPAPPVAFEPPRQAPVVNQRPPEPLLVARSTHPRELQGNPSFAQPASAVPRQEPVKVSSPKPIIEFVTKPAEARNFRLDHSHQAVDPSSGRYVPAPKSPTQDFQPDADLNRILKKLEATELQLNDSAEAVEAAIEQAHARFRSQDTLPTERVRSVHPAEFAQRYRDKEPTAAAEATSDHHRQESERLTRSEIIQTISSAIVSVLTDKTEPMIEAKIRQHMQQLQLEIVPQTEPVYESTIDRSENWEAPTDSVAALAWAGSADQTTTQATRKNKEIPVTVAAWDVTEFRWPSITSQMIKVGAEAIGALASTLQKTLVGTRRRVAITAPEHRAGSTSIAISLARWVAMEGGRVLLVDANLAHPELSSLVGLGPGISWLNALADRSGVVDTAEFIIRSQQSPICVMPLFPASGAGRPAGKLLDQLGKLLDPVAFDFDLILLDVGPVHQVVAELGAGSNVMDTALIVHQDKTFSINHVQHQLRALDVEQFVFAQNSVQQPRSNVA